MPCDLLVVSGNIEGLVECRIPPDDSTTTLCTGLIGENATVVVNGIVMTKEDKEHYNTYRVVPRYILDAYTKK